MSAAQEMELGRQINDSLMSQEFTRLNNDNIQGYVEQIGQRIAAHSQRPDINYVFQVVDDEQVNAFATLGGFVYVTTGLMKTADNEAELAGVVGHEIGHIEGKHLIDQIWQSAWQQGLLTAGGLDRSTAAQLGVELALNRPKSREAEHDADDRGLRLMGDAGYAQSAMASFMSKLAELGGSPPQILSTHPSPVNRVRTIEGNINPAQRNGDGLDGNAYRSQIAGI
jgi:predicted Zn-dependent protease